MGCDRIFDRWSASYEKWRLHVFQSRDLQKRCTYFDFSNTHQDFDLSCHTERENDKDMLLTGIMMGGDEHLTTLHSKIHISLLYKRCQSTDINISLKELSSLEVAKEYSWHIRSSKLIECPLLAVEPTFINTTLFQEYRYNIESTSISFTKHTEQFNVMEKENTKIDFLEHPVFRRSVKYSAPTVHHHCHIYTIRKVRVQPASPGEMILSDFEYEFNFELKVTNVVATTTGCNPSNAIDPQIEYFVNPPETQNHIQTKLREFETSALVVSSVFLRHYRLAALIPKEIDLIERIACAGCFVWTADEIIQIVHVDEIIFEYSTIIIYETYTTGIEDAETKLYSGRPVFVSKKPVYYSYSPLQTFNLLCTMIPPKECTFDTETSMFERFFTVLTGNPYKSQAASDPRKDLLLNNSVL